MKNFRLKFVLTLLLMGGGILSAAAQEIKGVVKDKSGEPVIGATVIVEGTAIGESTDVNGEWALNIPNASSQKLEISFIGMKTQVITIGSQTFIETVLEDDSTTLDDVVVIGYATVSRRDVVGSVSSVNAETLAQMPVASVSEAMSGRMAGVSVTTSEGDPDADIKIRVRGAGSITQDSSPLYIVDGFPVESISDIPASDIQSIDVLKDAFSTAIYGSRGANGVVLVTTKSGTSDRVTVNYNGYVGIKNMANKDALAVQNVNDFVRTQYEYELLDGSISGFENMYGMWSDIDLYKNMKGIDWVDQIFGRTGVSNDHNISVTGGGEKFKMSLSYAHHDENAIMINSNYKRDNLAFKTSYSPNKRVTLDVNARYSNTRVRGAGANALNDLGSSSGTSRLGNSIIYSPLPFLSIFDDASGDTEEDLNVAVRPDVSVRDDDKKRERVNWNVNGAFSWEIVDNLRLRIEGGLDDYRNTDNYYLGVTSYYSRISAQAGYKSLPVARYVDQTRKRMRSTNTLQYNFKKLLPENHSLDLLLGMEYVVTNSNTMTAEVQGLPEFFDADLAWKNMSSGGYNYTANVKYATQDRLFSFFGRANYDYKGKYSLSATMRADGSSKFARGNRWGYFPSAAAAWRISGEEFMSSAQNWLDNLKLRYSFGTAGNNNIPSGQIIPLYSSSNTGNSGLGNVIWGTGTTDMPNPDLKWETTWSHNLGLDFSFWNARLSGSVEVYQSDTKDLLIHFPVQGAGYEYQYRNFGSIRNRGIEVTLNASLVRKEKWGIDFSGNISFNKNEVTDLGALDQIGSRAGMFSTETAWDDFRVKVGRPIGDVYGLVNDGMYTINDFDTDVYNQTGRWVLKEGVASSSSLLSYDPRPGSPKFIDTDGNGVINGADAQYLGNVQAKFNGGFSLSAYFYGFDLAANFTYSYGNMVLNANKIGFSTTRQKRGMNVLDIMSPENRWTNIDWNTGEEITDLDQLARVNAGKTMWTPYSKGRLVQSWALEDASFLRLASLTLGYTLPQHLTKKILIQRIRVYVTGTNLFCLTPYSGYDPEVDTRRSTPLTPNVDYSAFPKSRSWVFGLNISF